MKNIIEEIKQSHGGAMRLYDEHLGNCIRQVLHARGLKKHLKEVTGILWADGFTSRKNSSIIVGFIFDDIHDRFIDGEKIYTSDVKEAKEIMEGVSLVSTLNSKYLVIGNNEEVE